MTEPQDLKEQPWFHNQVLEVFCKQWNPHDLLQRLLSVENELGRTRNGPRFGPRVIDIDLLVFGSEIIQSKELQIPHPRMRKRAFVLVPLAEIAPDFVFPEGGSVSEALAALNYTVENGVISE